MSDTSTQPVSDYFASLTDGVEEVLDPYAASTSGVVDPAVSAAEADPTLTPVYADADALAASTARGSFATPEVIPQLVDEYLNPTTTGSGTALLAETERALAAEASLQSEIDGLDGRITNEVGDLNDHIDDVVANQSAADAAINQAIADELAARAAAIAAEQAARLALATATTTALAQASADIQAAEDAAAAALATAQAEIEQASDDAAAALATARTDLQGAIDATADDLQTAINAVQTSSDGVLAQLNTEVAARQSADAAEVTARTAAIAGVQSDIGTVAAALTAEQTARATADSAEVTARQAAVATVQGNVNTVSAALAAEQTARADADSAETAARQAAVSTVQNNINTVSAALTAEATTRANADSAETTARQAAVSSLQGQINDATAAITAEATTRATNDTAETNARTAAVSNLQGQINTTNAAITSEASTRATADTAETNARQAAISQVNSDISAANAAITSEAQTRANADATETSQRQAAVSSLQQGLDSANAAIVSEANTRAAADATETSQRQAAVSSLQTGLDNATAAIAAEATTRASADTAETNARQAAISSLQTALNSTNAAITAEANTRAAADTAETNARNSQVSDLQGQINSATAAISNEATTRATNDTAETNARTSAVSSLSAKGSPKRIWSQSTAPTYADIFPPGVQACPLGNLDKATPFGDGLGSWTNTARTLYANIDLPGYTLEGGHTVFANLSGPWAAQGTYECFNITWDMISGVVPGATYEWSLYVGAHRCRGILIMAYYDAGGAYITENLSNANDGQEDASGGLSTYRRLYVRATVPNNTASIAVALRGDNQGANNKVGQVQPYIFGTRPQLARVTAEHPTPLDWQPFDAPAWVNTGDNNKTYRWSGIGGATWVEQSDLRIAANAAAITAEASTRASEDLAETNARTLAVSGLQGQINDTNAAVATEVSTRTTQDAAQTAARNSAVSSLQGQINDTNAAILTEQSTRASADSAETTARQQQVSQLSTPGGALVDPIFSRSAAIGTGTVPWGWGDWSWGYSLCLIAAGKIGDKAVRFDNLASRGVNQGIYMSPGAGWTGPDLRTNRYFVVEIDFEYISGDLTGAGFLLYGADSSGGTNDGVTDRATFLSVTGSSPQTGRIYTLRKFVDGYGARVPSNPSTMNTWFHLFGAWEEFSGSAVTKSFIIHRANVRAATQTEIENGTVSGAVGAAITAEANTRASADSAETSARQSAVSSLQNGLNSANAAIASESSTRAAADAAEATARLTLSSTLSAQISPKRTFNTATQPTFAEMFPANVQACPVANLKPSDGLNGIGAWTNTARTISDFGFYTNGSWNLTGESSVGAHLQGAWAAAATYECFDINSWGQCYNVVAGARYEWSVYTGSHRCRTFVGIYFYDDNWNYLGGAESTGGGSPPYTLGGVNNSEKSGGGSGTLADWKRLGVIVQAPAGATRANFFVRSDNQGSSATGQTDPYCFACRPYFGRARPDQTTFTDWQPFQPALWLKSSENNKAYLWSGIYGAGFVAVDDTRLSAHSTSISQLMSTTDGLKAMWGVQINTDGKVVGRVKLDGSGGTSEFSVLATSFTVSMPGYNSPIFEVGNVGGTPKITMRADVIQDGSVTDGKVGNVNLNAPTFASGSGSASVTVSLRGGQSVAIIAKASAAQAGFYAATFSLSQGATTLATDSGVVASDASGVSKVLPMVLLASFTPASTGNYTFTAQASGYIGTPNVALYVDRPYK